jgi:hypothetical protein
MAPLTVTMQVAGWLAQAPLQPLKTPLDGGWAVRVMDVPPVTVKTTDVARGYL